MIHRWVSPRWYSENVWIIPAGCIMRSQAADQDMWATTTEKKYREPIAYKVLDKITAFKNKML